MKVPETFFGTDRAKLKKIILRNGILIVALLCIYTVFNLITHQGCPIRWILHIPCPFCGMTRAHLAAFRLDFATAFSYHPLFPLGIPYLLLLFSEDMFSGKWNKLYYISVIAMTVIFVARYAISLFLQA